ncbi:hypothetical protein D3C87_1898300 [compost metagenome]
MMKKHLIEEIVTTAHESSQNQAVYLLQHIQTIKHINKKLTVLQGFLSIDVNS